RAGLKARGQLDRAGHDETCYLDPLDRLVDEGRTQAENLLALHAGEWGGKVDPVFDYAAY
ncbi:MAG TPA: glutamate--cysteine ligase, partial [Rhabdaerophilum sp.]|nr:glutamate--cysteine ligase [Rhabdaerophilum sp.]